MKKGNEYLIEPSTQTGWLVHEVANALGPIRVASQEPDLDIDVNAGRKILEKFLDNLKNPNPNTKGQRNLSDDEMTRLAKDLLDMKWESKNFPKLLDKYDDILRKSGV